MGEFIIKAGGVYKTSMGTLTLVISTANGHIHGIGFDKTGKMEEVVFIESKRIKAMVKNGFKEVGYVDNMSDFINLGLKVDWYEKVDCKDVISLSGYVKEESGDTENFKDIINFLTNNKGTIEHNEDKRRRLVFKIRYESESFDGGPAMYETQWHRSIEDCYKDVLNDESYLVQE